MREAFKENNEILRTEFRGMLREESEINAKATAEIFHDIFVKENSHYNELNTKIVDINRKIK